MPLPFVTSSSTGTDGIGAGSGFPAMQLDRSVGVAKAYCTRVGEGPFPTEETGPDGEIIREEGREYGSTTGRPRRCGWFDAPAVRYALELCGARSWIMTNLDVLSVFDAIPVGVAYRLGGERRAEYPAELAGLERVEAVYEKQAGWRTDITSVRRFEDLPAAARGYVAALEQRVGAPVELISVGPERDQIIRRGS